MTRGEYMRQARKRAGLTIKQLGRLSGVGYSTVSELERDIRNDCRISTLELLEDTLRISIDEYVGHTIQGGNNND